MRNMLVSGNIGLRERTSPSNRMISIIESYTVLGTIPAWLNGHVMRNGPGEFDIGPDTFKHFFDGHTLIHK